MGIMMVICAQQRACSFHEITSQIMNADVPGGAKDMLKLMFYNIWFLLIGTDIKQTKYFFYQLHNSLAAYALLMSWGIITEVVVVRASGWQLSINRRLEWIKYHQLRGSILESNITAVIQ